MIKLLKNTAAGLSLLFLIGCAGTATTAASDQSATASTSNDASAGGTTQTANNPQSNVQQATNLEGAWRAQDNQGNELVMLVQDGFFTVARFNRQKFLDTYGGTYTVNNGNFDIRYEFHTLDSTKVGSSTSVSFTLNNNQWNTKQEDATNTWQRIDESRSGSPLAGTWRITGRASDGQMNTMRPGPRKTLKVLSGTRFQWIAFNSETGEFSGTGGGTYTAENGTYTENIEFFSRDNSRVGMSLSFNYEVKDGNWHHTGQSSTGNPVNEIWSRISKD